MDHELRGNWSYPTTIWFGAGRLSELSAACSRAGIARPLVVADRALSAIVERAVAMLDADRMACTRFEEFRSNPLATDVEAGCARYRAGRHDGVVAIGGGSALDTGKLIAFMHGQTRPMWDFEDIGDDWTRADSTLIAPVVTVPTTAGTGSEIGRAGVVTDPATQTKKVIFHPRMIPVVVIADPELTYSLPPHLTAATGMDALAHLLEAWFAPFDHPYADGIALEGLHYVHQHLARAVADGSDRVARAHMLAASQLGGAAFQKGLGAIHALSHPIGALFDTHHGLTNAVVMPYVLAFNRRYIEDRATRLARHLDLARPGFDALLAWILELRSQIGIPPTLAALGVRPAEIPRLAAMALRDPTASGNPRPLEVPLLERLFSHCIAGRLDGLAD